jgi:lysophospholipase L1-like esterase
MNSINRPSIIKYFSFGFAAFTALVSSGFGQTSAPVAPRPINITWPLPQQPPTTPWASFPVPRLDWIARFETNIDKLKDGPYDLIFDGDSITDNWQSQDGSSDVWKKHYGAIKAVDLGIGGDQVQHITWRAQNGSLAGQDPKLIVVMAGTNNIGQKEEDVAAGIKMLLGEYETRCPHAHILLLGIFPRDPKPDTDPRKWVANVNKIISTYDSDKRITYMDIGPKFLQPDGTIPYETMRDGLHPSPAGYVIWADAIQPVIDQYFPKPANP